MDQTSDLTEDRYPYMWIASDREGHVGVFSTTGEGPFPSILLDPTRILVEDIEERVLELPQNSDYRLLKLFTDNNYPIKVAKCGLFLYVWTDPISLNAYLLDVYELVAEPTVPIAVTDLPSDIAAMFSGINFDNVSFGAEPLLDARAHFDCRDDVDVV